MRMKTTPALLLACAGGAIAQTAPEWGAITWQRDFATAQAAARETGKPVLLLFQEVPG
jgi:hypothetical protein